MTSPQFHNTIYLHGPHQPEVTWVEPSDGRPGWPVISTSGASLLVQTVAEADALILAAVAAKDLLLSWEPPPPALDPGCICGRTDGSDYCPVHNNRIAVLPAGHGENHIGNAGNVLGCDGECHPGTCITCGATVSAVGVVTPAEPVQVST